MGDHLLRFLKHLSYVILILTSVYFHGRVVSGSRVGVCYGMLGDNLPSRLDVVEHYKLHKIDKMRLYFPDSAALQALKGSNIELILDVPYDKLQSLAASGQAASDWVNENIVNWPDVRFKYISVGNEVFPDAEKGIENVLPAMSNVYNALKAAGLSDKIKVSTAIRMNVLAISYPPSAGAFNSSSMTAPIVRFLASIGSPLLCNVYPYFAHADNPTTVSLEYALFKSPKTVFNDGNLQYQNLFDAMVDSIYSAMEKVGGGNVGIVISETGWPSKGEPTAPSATIDNAASYNWNVINHVEKGTPKRPGPLETYIFALFNENQKNGRETERNFGLFYPNWTPVYSLQF